MNSTREFSIWDVILVLTGLTPVYISDSLSINYIFILIPFLSINIHLKVSKKFIIYFSCFLLIYIFSFSYVTIFQIEKLDRSFLSFMLFLTPFCWGAFKMKKKFYNSLLIGLLIYSLSINLWQIFTVIKYVSTQNLTDFYSLKDVVGSNRISFIFIVTYFMARILVNGGSLVLIRIIISLGILFTFSRAALITFLITVLFDLFLRHRLFKLRTLVLLSVMPPILVSLLYFLIPEI